MNSKFNLSFDATGFNILFRGRNASDLLFLDADLNALVYFDPCSNSHTLCPDQFSTARSEKFLFNYNALSLIERNVISCFFEFFLSKYSSSAFLASQRDAYFDLLSLNLDVVCKFVKSKTSFIRCFLYSYYGYVLHFYNPDFGLEDLPF